MGSSGEAGKQGWFRDVRYGVSRGNPLHRGRREEKSKENKELDLGCRMPQEEEK